MSKRGGKKGKAQPPASTPFSNNAFSGLSALASGLPNSPSSEAQAAPQPAPVGKPRFPNKLVVRMEKKGRRGKTVTRISGVPSKELVALGKELKKALGCGATIEEMDLILLGDLVERAVSWFENAGAKKIARGT